MADVTDCLGELDQKYIWHPYTQMKLFPESIPIVRGAGTLLFDDLGNEYIDAISSWWVNIHGHAHPYIAGKIFNQASLLEHCIFAGFTHPQAITLAGRLLEILPGKQARIFYSDDGSTAVEVAIKMALQYWANLGSPRKRILALEHAYHGDTFGAMSLSARSLFTSAFSEFLFDVDFIAVPESPQLNLAHDLREYAALIVEPLVQGSGGMLMHDAQALGRLIHLCREAGMIIIADEVMTGFGRTGKLFAMESTGEDPDIICLSKGLTGGTMALGITSCTASIYESFLSEERSRAFFHGHSYTANPIACAAANASLDLLLSPGCREDIIRIEQRHRDFARKIAGNPFLKNIRQRGTILAFDVVTSSPDSYTNPLRDWLYHFFISRKIILRPLGNTVYIMPPYCITDAELAKVYQTIEEMCTQLPGSTRESKD
jgi:adenosylmethionine-8-amino-7-oxononanoate aminotransferase